MKKYKTFIKQETVNNLALCLNEVINDILEKILKENIICKYRCTRDENCNIYECPNDHDDYEFYPSAREENLWK